MTTLLWHPSARQVIIPEAPNNLKFTGGGKKLVWHTTEGPDIDGAVGAYHQAGVAPHFTIQVKDGRRTLYQHLPINRAASALRHPGGPATNTANAIQVEIVGFAAGSGEWSQAMYRYLWHLARWVHDHFGVPMTTDGVLWRNPVRMSGDKFYNYSGHCGHVHVPGNDHSDPGRGFHIGYVLHGLT